MSATAVLEPVTVATPQESHVEMGIETSPNGEALYEIVNGEYVEKPPMSALATVLNFELASEVNAFVKPRKLGRTTTETLFVISAEEKLNRRPDTAFVSRERWPLDRPIPYYEDPWPVVPNLAVEVISPSNEMSQIFDKLAEYFKAGVELAWVVLPRQQLIHVYESLTKVRVLERKDELDGGKVIPDFRLPLSDLFTQEPSA